MKKRELLKGAFALGTLSALTPRAFAAVSPAIDPTINVENQNFWGEMLDKYRHDKKVTELLFVRYLGGCNARIQFYVKSGKKEIWHLKFESAGYVGKQGIDKEKEGDAKTPTGDFGVLEAFGIMPNPGTALPWIDVTPTTYACDEQGSHYNKIIDTKKTGHQCKGEEMYEITPCYNYGIATDFNKEGVWPKGSAIFVHVKGAKPYTGGCIALDEADMVTVLKAAHAGMRVIVHGN